jgi:predicted TIM-barrel fold metal-dependent hydrolase
MSPKLPDQIIDTHLNIVDPDFHYPWTGTLMPESDSPFLGQDLNSLASEQGLIGVVICQLLTDWRATRKLMALPETLSIPAKLIPRVELDAPGVLELIQSISSNSHVAGVRHLPASLEEEFKLEGAALDAVDQLANRGLVLELLLRENHMDGLIQFLETTVSRKLKLAINHLLWPDIQGDLTKWKEMISLLAEHSNIWLKASFLVPTAYPERRKLEPQDYFECLSHAWQAFGKRERMVFASDFPNAATQASYGQVKRIWSLWANHMGLNPSELRGLFVGNAERLYGEF